MKRFLKKKIIVILVVSAILSCILFLVEHVFINTETSVTRKAYGEGKKVMEYEVAIEGEDTQSLQIEVEAQEYTHEEMQSIFREVSDRLDEIILGENESFDRVEKDLNLVTEVEDYPVQIQWQLDSYSVLNLYGEIQEDNLVEEGTLVELQGTLSYKEEKAIYVQYARVYPLTRKGVDKLLYELGQKVHLLEVETREEESFVLPQELNGKRLTWTQKEESRWHYILLLGATACVYSIYRENEKEKKKVKHRNEEMIRDYPGLVSKLTMLLSTGTTVRNAWEKIVQDYERQKGDSGIREVYEEMFMTVREMQGGIAEAEAYERFGKRCGMSTYIKFGALLSQNLRKGSRGISEILKMEAIQSFENRKNTAKRLGEEAGTKLLLPMLGMLAVVFIMVMVPAFLSMQI